MRFAWTIVLVAVATAILMSTAGVAAAVQPPAGASAAGQGAPPESPDQFVPVKTLPAPDQLPAAPLVMAAYGFVWAALLVYVWTIWRRLMKVEREMHELSARLGEKR